MKLLKQEINFGREVISDKKPNKYEINFIRYFII